MLSNSAFAGLLAAASYALYVFGKSWSPSRRPWGGSLHPGFQRTAHDHVHTDLRSPV